MIEPKNLLIVRTDRIGDVVLSLPLAGIVKKYYPETAVSFMVRQYTKSVVSGNSGIDEVIVLKENKNKTSVLDNIRQLKKHKYDTCLIVYPTFRVALIMFLSGIRYRIGTGYRWYSFLFTHKIYEHRKYAERHELEYNINLLQYFNIKETADRRTIDFGIRINGKTGQKIEQLLSENHINLLYPVVIFHPGSGGSAVDWPLYRFRELIKMMAQELECNIIITGSEAEKAICDELVVNESVLNLAGCLNLEELIALIGRSDVLVANSTGPIHLAAALKKFVIGFYPKITACSPQRWGPFNDRQLIFTPRINCDNCTREQCEKLRCMDSIDSNEVFENIKSVLKREITEK